MYLFFLLKTNVTLLSLPLAETRENKKKRKTTPFRLAPLQNQTCALSLLFLLHEKHPFPLLFTLFKHPLHWSQICKHALSGHAQGNIKLPFFGLLSRAWSSDYLGLLRDVDGRPMICKRVARDEREAVSVPP